jgi:hypothetical protein
MVDTHEATDVKAAGDSGGKTGLLAAVQQEGAKRAANCHAPNTCINHSCCASRLVRLSDQDQNRVTFSIHER